MVQMIVIGADTHKDSHTLAAVDAGIGQVLAEVIVRARRRSFEDLLVWARGLDDGQRVWAIEDCRHVCGALERFLLARGECVMRVPPKLMAGARKSARERGKSDTIDAVAIARAAIKEGLDTLPVAQLAGPERDLRLLVDHRERLVAQRTALINDLRWGLHDLELPSRALVYANWQERVAGRLARAGQIAQVRIARDELRRIRELTRAVDALERELADMVAELAPQGLVEVYGVGAKRECAGEVHAPPLGRRQVGDGLVDELADLHRGERVDDPLSSPLWWHARVDQRDRQAVARRAAYELRVLHRERDRAAALDRACGRRKQAGQSGEKRALARACRPHHQQHLACWQVEVDTREHFAAPAHHVQPARPHDAH